MRIAFFTDTFYPQVNGVSNTLRYLSLYLQKKGIEHLFFAPDYGGESEECGDLPVVRFKGFRPPVYPDCRLAYIPHARLMELLEEYSPDLIHIVTEFGIGYSGLKAARALGIPVVMSYHTNFDRYLQHYGAAHLKQTLWAYMSWFHSFSLLNLGPSRNTLDDMERHGFRNLALWPRGISTERFSPLFRSEDCRARLNGAGKTVYLYVGRISAEKGLDVLMKSIAEFNRGHTEDSVFWITGDGPYRAELEACGYPNVIFTGQQQGEELSRIYASADVFVFPSGTETFGNVLLEAMASGLPAICTDSGGVTDYTVHNQNALVTRFGNAADLECALEAMLDPSLRSRIRENALRTAGEKSWEQVLDGLLEQYRATLSRTEIGIVKGA